MRQFLEILRFEYLGYIKNKVFIGITVVVVAALAILLSFPRITAVFDNGGEESGAEESTGETVLIRDDTGEGELSLSFLAPVFPGDSLELTEASQEELEQAVERGECSRALILAGDMSYVYIVESLGIYDSTQQAIEEALTAMYQTKTLTDLGLDMQEVEKVMGAAVTGQLVQMGKDQAGNFLYTYVLIMLLYMAIVIYGQLVANSVAIEKGSRAMELLITSARPKNLMFGKVLGAGLAGLTQLIIMLGSAFLFFQINKDVWEGNAVVYALFNMPPQIFLYTLLFFLLGYFIYAFLYGAVGSMATKVEDLNTTSMPVMFMLIAVFLVVIMGLAGGTPDSGLMVVASFIPVSSPMAMFVRITMSQVPAWQVAVSVGLAVASIFGIGYISAKIYKVGVLLYGKTPKLSQVIKAMRDSKT